MTQSLSPSRRRWLAFLALIATSSACNARLRQHTDVLAAGDGTIIDGTRNAFTFPMPNLPQESRRAFFVGNSYFNDNWVSAPASVTTRDGLGPLFNARSCSSCHFKDGRSRPPNAGEAASTLLLRVSVPGRGQHGESLGDPVYGDQIQGSGSANLSREADVFVDYQEASVELSDRQVVQLRKPSYRLEHPGYGVASKTLMVSARVAPIMPGLGLLQAISDADLLERADPDDQDHDGVSGRANQVWDATSKQMALGRFGWKAEQPTVLQQAAAAFLGDMGITSSLFPRENHTGAELQGTIPPSGGSPEVSDDILSSVVLYARSLAVPARREQANPSVLRGEQLFVTTGCAACHVATWKTAPVSDLINLGRQTIHPYTDLLLHDMGEGLSDGRPSFDASGGEWRTPPLWGIGLISKVNQHTFFLHDGRARNLTEAIVWHGGEASRARAAFVHMPQSDRGDVLNFLRSL